MAVTEYIVENVGAVAYTVSGVIIQPGTSRNLVDDGVTLEQIARDQSLTAGLLAGDLIGPAQTWWCGDAQAGSSLVPGGVYYVAPSVTVAPFSLVLPPALATVQVPLPIIVQNESAGNVELALVPPDTITPASAATVTPGQTCTLWSVRDPGSGAWGYAAQIS